MRPRDLRFQSYADVIVEIEELRRRGYTAAGKWNLARTCEHLSYYYRGSLDGFEFKLPWIIRKVIGRAILRRILKKRGMRRGRLTIPASVAPAETDEAEAVARAVELLKRLDAHRGEVQLSPLFDRLTLDEARELHLIHSAHHLRLLRSNSS